MQIIVQEGRASLSLIHPIIAHDDLLRSTSIQEINEDVKVFYRDFEIIRVEARDGSIEILPSALAGVFWVEKGRRYQLKPGE
jgi:hypothetical protein